jgi:hypothetical protein
MKSKEELKQDLVELQKEFDNALTNEKRYSEKKAILFMQFEETRYHYNKAVKRRLTIKKELISLGKRIKNLETYTRRKNKENMGRTLNYIMEKK